MLALLAAVQATTTTPTITPEQSRQVASASLTLARRIVGKMGVDRQLRSVLKDLAPMFAGQMLSTTGTSDQADSPLRQAAIDPTARQRIAVMLAEEYVRAFEARLPELAEAVAATYVSHLSFQELEALDRFLDTPAGNNWVTAISAAQSEAAELGGRLGAEAGEAAYDATLRRLKDAKP